MNLKDQLIHDICVLQERINCCYDEAPQRLRDVKKLEERQRKAVDTYLDEVRPRLTFDSKPAFASKSKVNFAELDEAGVFSRHVDPINPKVIDICHCINGEIVESDNGIYWCKTCGSFPVITAGPKTVEQ